jgi:hypothetical protein
MVSHYGKGIHKVETVKYPTVTLMTDTTKTAWPRVIEINYGPLPGIADSSDGKTRSGIIYASFNNWWNIIGTTCTITFNTYLVNGVSYNATITALETKPTEFKVDVVNGVCTSSSWKIAFAATRTFEWVGGYNDSVPSHSQYTITGMANGTDRNTTNYTLTITSALTKRLNCPSVCGGSEQIIPAGLANRTVNFGNGTCTGSASVTINGQSFTVSE